MAAFACKDQRRRGSRACAFLQVHQERNNWKLLNITHVKCLVRDSFQEKKNMKGSIYRSTERALHKDNYFHTDSNILAQVGHSLMQGWHEVTSSPTHANTQILHTYSIPLIYYFTMASQLYLTILWFCPWYLSGLRLSLVWFARQGLIGSEPEISHTQARTCQLWRVRACVCVSRLHRLVSVVRCSKEKTGHFCSVNYCRD